MIFRGGDSFQALHDAYWAQARTETGYTHESQCPTIIAARSIGQVTVDDGIAAFVANPAEFGGNIDWIARNGLPLLGRVARRPILRALSPASACVIYIHRAYLLSPAEDAILLRSWLPTMGAMRRRHEAGTLKRKEAPDA